jgi:hypothetical protein
VSLFGYRERRRIAELEAREQVRLRHIGRLETQLRDAGLTPGQPSRPTPLTQRLVDEQCRTQAAERRFEEVVARIARALHGPLDGQTGGAQ